MAPKFPHHGGFLQWRWGLVLSRKMKLSTTKIRRDRAWVWEGKGVCFPSIRYRRVSSLSLLLDLLRRHRYGLSDSDIDQVTTNNKQLRMNPYDIDTGPLPTKRRRTTDELPPACSVFVSWCQHMWFQEKNTKDRMIWLLDSNVSRISRRGLQGGWGSMYWG